MNNDTSCSVSIICQKNFRNLPSSLAFRSSSSFFSLSFSALLFDFALWKYTSGNTRSGHFWQLNYNFIEFPIPHLNLTTPVKLFSTSKTSKSDDEHWTELQPSLLQVQCLYTPDEGSIESKIFFNNKNYSEKNDIWQKTS